MRRADAANCCRLARSVVYSVLCLPVSRTKTAEPIEMPFRGGGTRVDHVLDQGALAPSGKMIERRCALM